MRILFIASNTFREAARNKMVHALLGLATVTILCSKGMAWVSAGEDLKVMTDLGLAAITLFGVIVALFSGANLLYREVERRTSYLILTKPVKRYEFIAGKYAGLALVLLVCLLAMSIVHAGYLSTFTMSMQDRPHGLLLRDYYLALGQAYLLIFFELCVLAAFAVLFSVVSSPMFSAVATFCVFFIGHGLRNVKDLALQMESPVVQKLLLVLYYVLPGLFNFDMKHMAAYSDPQSVGTIVLTAGYAVAYCVVILSLTCAIFKRRQL